MIVDVVKVGDQYQMLTVLEISGRRVTCRCACGAIKTFKKDNVASGNSGSCGCRTRTAARARLHRHGLAGTSTHNIWWQMIERCTNPNAQKYKWYGGRGVTVCERWMTFENFVADMGERPRGLTIDRIDYSKGYEPGNCRWTTWRVQRRNRADVKLEPHEPSQIVWLKGEGYGAREIATYFDINPTTVHKIVKGRLYNDLTGVTS